MRKHISLILKLFVIVSLVFAITACSSEPQGSVPSEPDSEPSGKTDPVQMPVEKEEGKQKLLALGAVDPSKGLVPGFSITATLNDGQSVQAVEIGGSDGIYWVGISENSQTGSIDTYHYFKERNNKTYTDQLGSWFCLEDSTLVSQVFGEIADNLLFSAYSDAIRNNLTFVEKTTIDGRACSLYSASINSQTIKFWVDDTYGITLKMEYEGVSSIVYTVVLSLEGVAGFPSLYEMWHNSVGYYIESAYSLSEFVGTWSAPYAFGNGTLTISAGGSATMTINSTDHAGSVMITGNMIVFTSTDGEAFFSGLLAIVPDNAQMFEVKNASYKNGIFSDDNSTLHFAVKKN
jgi:hypothetical protein